MGRIVSRATAANLFVMIALSLLFAIVATSAAYADANASTTDDIEFVFIENSILEPGETQSIVIGFSDNLDDQPVGLVICDEDTGTSRVFPVVDKDGNSFVFRCDDHPRGCYAVKELRFQSGIVLSVPESISAHEYKVIDSTGISERQESLNTPLTSYRGETSDPSAASALNADDSVRARSNKVVVLDAGHGGWDSGAAANGLLEKNLTLKIAKYCQVELEQYAGVEVIMVRDGDYAVSGTTNTSKELQARCAIAYNNGASLYVSFHINAGGGNGAEVWVPNTSSWYAGFHDLGAQLGENILKRLQRVGFSYRGIKYSEYGDLYYADGSDADGLAVIRHCREYGIPAVLVEHGFIDTAYDAGLLASDYCLNQMGVADATAIANQLGLSKEKKPSVYISNMDNGAITLSWDAVPGASKYAIAKCNSDGTFETYSLDCADTQYTINGLKNGEQYQFLVQANIGGRWSSFTSDDYILDYLVPWPKVAAEPAGDGRVALTWGAVDGAEAYAVAEKLADGSYRTFTLTATGTSYAVSDLANGVEHRFLVQARVGGRWSSYGDACLAAATPQGTTRPAVAAVAGDGCVSLSWGRVPGAERYAVAWREAGAGRWTTSTYECRGGSYRVGGLSNGTAYEFVVQAWAGGRWSDFSAADVVRVSTCGTLIMGSPQATVSQMVACYMSTGHEYPSSVYSAKGASAIGDFCDLVYKEAVAEGVRPEVLFSQAMYETGWLQFGGSVDASQCNFGGIGAISSSASGASFSDVAMGLRAQAQHLKAYASMLPLNQPCVDPRFNMVIRGCAPTLEDLNGKWAVPGKDYGQRISAIVSKTVASRM